MNSTTSYGIEKNSLFCIDYERCNRELVSSWKKMMFSPKSRFETCTAKTKYRNKYSLKMNIGVSVPISTFICLWANYIFLRSACLFCCRKYVEWTDPSLTDTWMWKLGLRPRNSQKRNAEMGFSLQCGIHQHQASVLGERWLRQFLPQVRRQKTWWLSEPIASAGILEQSMGAGNQVGIRLSYRPARLHRLAESIPGLLKSLKIPSQDLVKSKLRRQQDDLTRRQTVLWIRIHYFKWIRIWIRKRIRIPIRIQDFDDQKLKKNAADFKKSFYWSKIAIYLSQTFLKDIQATEDAFSTSKD